LEVHLGGVLFRLLLTLGDTPRAESVIDVDVDVEETLIVSRNSVIGEFPVIDLAMAH